jgi:hypothetical protein
MTYHAFGRNSRREQRRHSGMRFLKSGWVQFSGSISQTIAFDHGTLGAGVISFVQCIFDIGRIVLGADSAPCPRTGREMQGALCLYGKETAHSGTQKLAPLYARHQVSAARAAGLDIVVSGAVRHPTAREREGRPAGGEPGKQESKTTVLVLAILAGVIDWVVRLGMLWRFGEKELSNGKAGPRAAPMTL